MFQQNLKILEDVSTKFEDLGGDIQIFSEAGHFQQPYTRYITYRYSTEYIPHHLAKFLVYNMYGMYVLNGHVGADVQT